MSRNAPPTRNSATRSQVCGSVSLVRKSVTPLTAFLATLAAPVTGLPPTAMSLECVLIGPVTPSIAAG